MGTPAWAVQAIHAARSRLRPIVMTSLAFILGVVPLMLATGAGAEMRQSLGTSVFSGMLGVTLFGLVFTPVFYVIVRAIEQRLTRTAPGTEPATGHLACATEADRDPAGQKRTGCGRCRSPLPFRLRTVSAAGVAANVRTARRVGWVLIACPFGFVMDRSGQTGAGRAWRK